MFPCWLWDIVSKLFGFYILLMLLYAVVSWVPSLRGRWSDYVAMAVEPVLVPVRRIIPPLGGLDLSFIVVIIVLQLVMRIVANEPCVR
ncbi:MAG: YggT family protein [Candidatus Eremiobacteraeota bacterium]|jgi:YggT family protein|nr:YggT family protein [Candidatus Eremiobacteraeota bacterium]